MKLTSLGYKTDLIFPMFDGKVEDRGDCIWVCSPNNPSFHWGNFLLFPEAPRDADCELWKERFRTEFAQHPGVKHFAFGWDVPQEDNGGVKEFERQGFLLNSSSVLKADTLRVPKHFNHNLTVRPLTTLEEWEAAIENQVLCRDGEFEENSYRIFKVKQMQRYRMMSERQLGKHFGAFLGSQLIADLGLYTHKNIGRFQNVCTHPNFRRQGVCTTLVYLSVQYVIDNFLLDTLVMVAEEEGEAKRIYKSLGFQEVEKQFGLSWWPRF